MQSFYDDTVGVFNHLFLNFSTLVGFLWKMKSTFWNCRMSISLDDNNYHVTIEIKTRVYCYVKHVWICYQSMYHVNINSSYCHVIILSIYWISPVSPVYDYRLFKYFDVLKFDKTYKPERWFVKNILYLYCYWCWTFQVRHIAFSKSWLFGIPIYMYIITLDKDINFTFVLVYLGNYYKG